MTQSRSSLSTTAEAAPPFDAARLDGLLDEAGMDAVVISSKHNIQYLFGGYRFFFFDHFDAIGVSRYLPLLVYVKGRPDQSTYIGHAMESYEKDLGKQSATIAKAMQAYDPDPSWHTSEDAQEQAAGARQNKSN